MSAIRKVMVTSGVFWIEIPERDFRLLCGCPADVVKHLMKRGHIVAIEDHGTLFETGPNAILLSDVALQNGSFANLAEFPVLQMLYRQGMLIPGHPGNTGRKPMIIGHPDQLDAQIRYIHRGNYGLVSKEEIMAAGIDAEMAEDMMRLKRKFAFGKISSTSGLLDTLSLGMNAKEIRDEIFIERKALNVFEISFMGEKVRVDLNLAPGESYPAPYPLGYFETERHYFSVVHSGSGDGWDINRPSMGSVLIFQGRIYLVDAGPNIESTLRSLGIGIGEIEGVFHTHCHDDHFAGLTALIRADHRIKYLATPLVRHSTAKKLCALMSVDESVFEKLFDIVDLDLGRWNNIAGLEVRPIFSPHPVETTVLMFRTLWGKAYVSYAHWADIVSMHVLKGMITEDDQKDGISRDFYDHIGKAYREPATLKKIDVGGGMIHGSAEDFRDDISAKKILAHTARPLDSTEKEIGSGAPFGTQDILIPGNRDYAYGNAFAYLMKYFPTLRLDQVNLLLNHEAISFNPESLIMKEGDEIHDIFFILSGTVEVVNARTGLNNIISSGSLIGELNSLHGIPASEAYRAASFVKALKIPGDLYRSFVSQNDLFEGIASLAENREFLEHTALFGEALSDNVKNVLAQAMTTISVTDPAQPLNIPRDVIALVKTGAAELLIGTAGFESLKPGDVFFEEHALHGMASIFGLRPDKNTVLALIPTNVVEEIPVVRWKLLETHAKRMRSLADTDRFDDQVLTWRPEYKLNIASIDQQHQELVTLTCELITAIEGKKNSKNPLDFHERLMECTVSHFADEEKLFRGFGYSDSDDHAAKHSQLLGRMGMLAVKLSDPSETEKREIISFLKRWITLHIVSDDRRYAAYIGKKAAE